ncbi:hypothetical protein [Candidatus Phytoplasma pini]|uniref:Uncharacterized protein n=1 Tax=Candidatus Phytoplasma pini TaxID=267362 RepID=A0A559KJ21_9MOLU|nr:hypothetical protein [Candidatus Phytoplasma pini]TVY12088.1 hypothetical protein MDPP_00375 [Candidatus Phytoplasma pini]
MLFFKKYSRVFFILFYLISFSFFLFIIDYFYTQKIKLLANYYDSEEIIFQLQGQIQEQQQAFSSLQMNNNLLFESKTGLQGSYNSLVEINCQQCNEIQYLKELNSHQCNEIQQLNKVNYQQRNEILQLKELNSHQFNEIQQLKHEIAFLQQSNKVGLHRKNIPIIFEDSYEDPSQELVSNQENSENA